MAENIIQPKTSVSSKYFTKGIKFVICPKLKKNKRRILRRKRSRLKYWNRRKEQKLNRNSKELCDTISVINITDMDYENYSVLESLPEVADWQKQQQIAYWKSRASALQFENQMLYKHIKNMYTQQIQSYVDYKDEVIQEEMPDRLHYGKLTEEQTHKKIWKAPEENLRKVKSDTRKKLYGDMAPKICGMETAIQLSYDLYLEKHDPKLWPNIPLRL